MGTGLPAVAATGIVKCYPGEQGSRVEALRGADLVLARGETAALYGRSGSGKTTLLNILAGLDRPDGGKVEIEGEDLALVGEKGRTALRRRRIGFVFQFFNLLPTLTVLENVLLSLELAGRGERGDALDALGEVGLRGLENRYPGQLSGGEQQRVAIARAIVKRPSLVLADEPTGNLDTVTADGVMELLLRRCREAGASLLVATHAPRTAQRTDRVLRMVDGRLEEVRGALSR